MEKMYFVGDTIREKIHNRKGVIIDVKSKFSVFSTEHHNQIIHCATMNFTPSNVLYGQPFNELINCRILLIEKA